MSRNGRPRPSPRAAKTAIDPTAGSNRAVPRAAPRKGPAQGVATKAASAPVPKLPAGCARPPSTGSSKSPSRFAVIAIASSKRSTIVRGSWSWNAQPACAPPHEWRGVRRRARGPDCGAGRIGERVRSCLACILACLRNMQCLQRENWKYARHEVEEDPACDRSQDGPKDDRWGQFADRAPPWESLHGQP